MARKRTGSAGEKDASPQDETVESAPRGYSIYSEKAERAAAEAARSPAPLAEPEAPEAPATPGERTIFAETEAEAPAPMSAAEARREAAEDAEILSAVDAAVAREIDPAPKTESAAPSEPSAAEAARRGWERDDRTMPETVAARPAPGPRSEPRSEPRAEPAYTPPPAAAPKPSGGIAGKLLGALLFLLIGAGLALWLGPRVAPSLPAPVAKFLEPGGPGTQARLASLDEAVASLRGELASRPAGVSAADVEGAVSAAQTRVEGELTELRNQIGAGTEVPERLARVESAAQGAQAELEALKAQIGSGGATATVGAVAPALDVYKGEIDGLQAEMGTLSDQVAALRTRVDEVGAEAKRQIDTAQATVETVRTEATQAIDTAAWQADVAAVGAALAAGQPFAEPLARLTAQGEAAIPAELGDAAQSGVPTLSELEDSFPKVAHDAIEASILKEAGDGLGARALALFRAQFAARSLEPREGADPDAVLSRMGALLDHGDLVGALAESEALPSEAKAAMGDWLNEAKLRAGAAKALAELQSATPATN